MLPTAFPVVASAEQVADPSQNLGFLLLASGLIVGAILLAIIPAAIAQRRRVRVRQPLLILTLLWTIFAAGTALMVQSAQAKWNSEQMRLLNSGYYDPRDGDASSKPQFPGITTSLLGIGYAALLLTSINAPSQRP